MTESPVDVASPEKTEELIASSIRRAILLESERDEMRAACKLAMGALDSALTALHHMSGLPDEVDDFDVICDSVRARLDRAQAASEGVDLLIAQAERRGAVRAFIQMAQAVNCRDDSTLANEYAEMVERGEDPFWIQPNTRGHQSRMCVDGDIPGVDCACAIENGADL